MSGGEGTLDMEYQALQEGEKKQIKKKIEKDEAKSLQYKWNDWVRLIFTYAIHDAYAYGNQTQMVLIHRIMLLVYRIYQHGEFGANYCWPLLLYDVVENPDMRRALQYSQMLCY